MTVPSVVMRVANRPFQFALMCAAFVTGAQDLIFSSYPAVLSEFFSATLINLFGAYLMVAAAIVLCGMLCSAEWGWRVERMGLTLLGGAQLAFLTVLVSAAWQSPSGGDLTESMVWTCVYISACYARAFYLGRVRREDFSEG